MSSIFWVTYGILWLVLSILALLVILLYRQFGLMIMPGGRRVSYGGLDIGARAPAVLLQVNDARPTAFDWAPLSSRGELKATFALFAMPGCPLCSALLRDQDGMRIVAQRHPSVQFLWVQAEDNSAGHIDLDPIWTFARTPDSAAHDAMEVPGSPFAYFIDMQGHILNKGLINRSVDIVAMIASSPTGVLTGERDQLATEMDAH
jgi:hypothetical protein